MKKHYEVIHFTFYPNAYDTETCVAEPVTETRRTPFANLVYQADRSLVIVLRVTEIITWFGREVSRQVTHDHLDFRGEADHGRLYRIGSEIALVHSGPASQLPWWPATLAYFRS